MKYFIFLCCFSCSLQLSAQIPEDALRLSWNAPSGTARQQAIGGAMGSLGGEISAAYVNPAGLGFYKTNEIVFSPGFRFQKDNSNYRGTTTTGTNASNFNIGTSGLVLGFMSGDGMSNTTIALAVNRTANFGSHISYRGQNDFSSFSEQYAEEFANSGMSIDQAINSPQISYGTRMALYSYLVDTVTIGGVTQVIGQPQKILNAHGLLNQLNNSDITGGITEVALGLAGNFKEKWFLGLTFGIPIVTYHRDLVFTESDATGDGNNDFASSTYTEHYSSTGGGVNLKLGAIYKPSAEWRIGVALHTPTWYALTDNLSASMSTNTEKYTSAAQPINITSQGLDAGSGNTAGALKYDLISPWKFLLSGSYIFGGGIADVKQQKGFITADAEYVTTNSSRFSPADNYTDANYFKAVNSAVKSYYKGTFNLRLGGELKFNTFAARAGVAYTTSPYKPGDLKADRLFLSGGVGYRNKGIFVDLTYVLAMGQDVHFPYRLADKANTFATLKQNSGTILMTVGVKF
jgi:hypothetical protein